MADHSTIEWTDATWNPIAGCSLTSPGCTNCYAMLMARRHELMSAARGRVSPYAELTRMVNGKAVWTGEVRAVDSALTLPLRTRKPTTWFVNSMSDLFHESVPDAWIDRIFAVMALCPQHTFQVLTKRSARMRAYLTAPSLFSRLADAILLAKDPTEPLAPHRAGMAWSDGRRSAWGVHRAVQGLTAIVHPWPLPNVWLGVSAEDQRRADERVPDLLATPAAVRFVSAEPLIGPINFREYLLGFAAGNPASCACGHGHGFTRCPNYGRVSQQCHRCSCTEFRKVLGADGLHWIIVGGESGPGARPMHPDWVRSIRDQCAAAGVAFFFKQWGEYGTAAFKISTGQPVYRQFKDFQHWVNKASTWVCGGICMDDAGRILQRGADFIRARDEGTFPVTILHRVGKKAAGRLLDGVEHNGMPEVRHAG